MMLRHSLSWAATCFPEVANGKSLANATIGEIDNFQILFWLCSACWLQRAIISPNANGCQLTTTQLGCFWMVAPCSPRRGESIRVSMPSYNERRWPAGTWCRVRYQKECRFLGSKSQRNDPHMYIIYLYYIVTHVHMLHVYIYIIEREREEKEKNILLLSPFTKRHPSWLALDQELRPPPSLVRRRLILLGLGLHQMWRFRESPYQLVGNSPIHDIGQNQIGSSSSSKIGVQIGEPLLPLWLAFVAFSAPTAGDPSLAVLARNPGSACPGGSEPWGFCCLSSNLPSKKHICINI